MSKIKVEGTVVELDGDEMTRIIWQAIKDTLIHPYLDVNLEYYDLSIQKRDETDDQITIDAAHAIQKHGVGVKCATITPDEARVEEFGLKKMWKLAERHDPQHPRRRHLPRADHHLEHPAPGARLEQADHHRPSRLRRPVPRHRLPLQGRGHAHGRRSPRRTAASRSSSRSSSPRATASRRCSTTSTRRSATSRAPRSTTASSRNYPVYLSTKNTILKAYDGRFKDIFQEIFDAEFKEQFDAAGLTYEHRLIDDMVASAMKWEGGYVWACKNYDGDVQSDTVAQGFGSLGLMTSRARHARRQGRRGRGGARHRDAPLPPAPAGQAHLDEPDRLDLRVDARPRRTAASSTATRSSSTSSHTLEDVVITTVESGAMTKDLAAPRRPRAGLPDDRGVPRRRSPTT